MYVTLSPRLPHVNRITPLPSARIEHNVLYVLSYVVKLAWLTLRNVARSTSYRADRRRTCAPINTTNLLEHLFVEERRRLKIIPNAFGKKPVLKLMFGAMIRAAERWRAIRISELERRQMRAVREKLDKEYEAANGLGDQPSAPAHQARLVRTPRPGRS